MRQRKRRSISHAEEEKRRRYIGAIYDMLGRPAEEKWKGKNGTIQLVCEILQLTPRKNYYRAVRKVLTSCASLNYEHFLHLHMGLQV